MDWNALALILLIAFLLYALYAVLEFYVNAKQSHVVRHAGNVLSIEERRKRFDARGQVGHSAALTYRVAQPESERR